MRSAVLALLVVVALLGSTLVGLGMATGSASAPTDPTAPIQTAMAGPLKGNITGPTVVATGASQRYTIQASGGPATAPNGTVVGNITFYVSVTAPNPTGVMITPQSALILNNTPGRPLLEAGSVAQVVTIDVELTSVLNSTNATLNLTYTVDVVQPYVVAAEIVNPNNATVATFPVIIDLDGVKVGNVSVPPILPYADYNLSFEYPTNNLSSGWHTFSISLTQAHGLLRFANGSTAYQESFYIPGPAPSYTLWYLTGIVAFVGVLLILSARLGARRRGAAKK